MHLRALKTLARGFIPTWARRPTGPSRAVVALTRRCDLRCGGCRTWEKHPGDEMTPAELGRLCSGMPNLT